MNIVLSKLYRPPQRIHKSGITLTLNSEGAVMSLGKVIMNIGFVRSLVGQGRLSWRLFRDPRVPVLTKSIPVLTTVYPLSPVNWLIEWLPVLGQMEDIAVLGLGMTLFIRLAPQEVVDEYRLRLSAGDQPPQLS